MTFSSPTNKREAGLQAQPKTSLKTFLLASTKALKKSKKKRSDISQLVSSTSAGVPLPVPQVSAAPMGAAQGSAVATLTFPVLPFLYRIPPR